MGKKRKLKLYAGLLLSLVVTLIINSVMPYSQIIAEGEGPGQMITENLMTDVELYDQQPIYNSEQELTPQGNKLEDIRPDISKEVAVVYQWSLPNDSHGYTEGARYTFQLPDVFKIPAQLNGVLDGDVGTYVVKTDGEVTFIFNDEISGTQLHGNFYVWVKFDQSKLGDGLQHTINFQSLGQIVVNFKNLAVDELKKSGAANNNNFNSTEVEWTVDFNQSEQDIENAVLEDTLPGGLALTGNIEVYQLDVQLDGSVKKGSLLQTGTAFPLNLGTIDNKAIRVVYKTSVTAPTAAPFTNKEYTNIVKLTGTIDGVDINKTDDAKVTISFNQPLSKSAKTSDYNSATQTTKWTVQYNYNQQPIAQSNAWLEDTFDSSNTTKQKLVASSLKVYEVSINSSGQATRINPFIDPNLYTLSGLGTDYDGGFKLQFKDSITKAYEIEYQTQAQDRIYKDETVKNTVKISNGITKTASQGIKEVVFSKAANKSDFNKKEIEWKLVVNKDLQPMSDIIIEDSYAGRHMKLVPSTLLITGLNKNDFVLVADSGDPNYESGFKIKLNDGITVNTEHVITYTTTFDPTAGMPADNLYLNSAVLSWKEDSAVQTPLTKKASVTAQSYTIQNGNKMGEYNAKDKTITWKIDVNYNLFDIQNAIIKDNYTGNQIFVPGSLKVNKLILSSANNVTSVHTAEVPLTSGQYQLNTDGKGFVLNLGNIGKTAYRISYKTSLEGEYAIEGSYTNHATLQDGENGDKLFEKGASVTPKHGGVYLEKTGQQKGQTDIAAWTVSINPSQSFVAAGAVLTDTLSDNQFLLKDSVKLYKTNIPSDDSGNVLNKNGLLDSGDYTLLIEGNSLILTFNKPLNTAYILEYESFINADNNERIKNKAEFKGQTSAAIGEGNVEGVKVAMAAAGGGASGGKGKIKVLKVDDLNNPLPGVQFELYNASGTTLLETLTTNADGQAQTARDYRYSSTGIAYRLKEVAAPSGFLIDSQYGAAAGKTIQFKNPASAFEVVNQILRQGFELTKSDSADSSQKLAGTVFELRLNGSLIDTLTTDINGKISKGDLLPGNYQLIEVTAPEYYILNSTPIRAQITANQTEILQLSHTNTVGTNARLTVTKVNAKAQALLAGVEFELRNGAGAVVGTKTTGVDGIAEFTNLIYGPYTLVETKADGYVIEKAETEVSINQPATALTIENKENDRSVKLTKYNSDKSKKLQGAVFELKAQTELFDSEGNYIYTTVTGIDGAQLTTDINGELILTNLAPNKYRLVEIQAPAGYILNKTPVAFEITSKQTEPVQVEKTNNLYDVYYPVVSASPNPMVTPSASPGATATPAPTPNPGASPSPAASAATSVSQPTVQPTPAATQGTTREEVPLEGDVPLGGVPSIGEKPENGKVTITSDGKWIYTPDPGFIGKDKFTIIVTDEEGDEEVTVIEINVEEVPRGTVDDPGSPAKLPQTGEKSPFPLYLLGGGLIILGYILNRRAKWGNTPR